jgi:hypothetical protein
MGIKSVLALRAARILCLFGPDTDFPAVPRRCVHAWITANNESQRHRQQSLLLSEASLQIPYGNTLSIAGSFAGFPASKRNLYIFNQLQMAIIRRRSAVSFSGRFSPS